MRVALVGLVVLLGVACDAGTRQPSAGSGGSAAPAVAPAVPVAVAVVVNNTEIWLGNDELETDEDARYQGVMRFIRAASSSTGS